MFDRSVIDGIKIALRYPIILSTLAISDERGISREPTSEKPLIYTGGAQ